MLGAKLRSTLFLLLKIAVGLGLLALVIYKANPRVVLHDMLAANRIHLAAAIFFIISSYFFGIKRWQILSRSLGIEVGFSRFVVLHFLGLFCNNFLPTGIGGDVVKAYYLGKSGQQHQSYLSVMLDRYVGLLVLLLVASMVAFLQPRDDFHLKLSYLTWGIFATFITGGIAMLFFTNVLARLLENYNKAKLVDKLRELSALTRGFLVNHYTLGTTLLLSIIAQALGIFAVYELSLAVGAPASPASMFVVVPLVLLVSVLPISIGGMGTREAAFVYLLSRVYLLAGMDAVGAQSAAAVVAVLWLAVNLLTSLPGAASYSMISRLRSQ